MGVTDTHNFDPRPEEVWAVLMDPNAIEACLRGCRELRPIGDNRYHADISIGDAAGAGIFTATVTVPDSPPPARGVGSRSGSEGVGRSRRPHCTRWPATRRGRRADDDCRVLQLSRRAP